MKRIGLFCVFVLLCALFAGAAFASEKVSAYATTEEPLAKELFDAFEKETGIKVDWVRLSSGEAVARLEAEKANPRASIWVGGVGTLHIDAKNKGLTAPYTVSPIQPVLLGGGWKFTQNVAATSPGHPS